MKGGLKLKKKNYHDKNILGKWSEIPYAGEENVPSPEEPSAGSWPTFFLNRDRKGEFLDPEGRPIDFKIRNPESIDFTGKQLKTVQKTLSNITKKEIKTAEYWGTGPPTKQWTPFIDKLIDVHNISAPRAGRILGAIQGALNDVLVVTWYLKFLWGIPRPNQLDRKLVTIICTPKHPGYPSGHAVVAGCTQIILSYFFPPKSNRMRELAEECAVSRLYGGVHFPVDNDEGLQLGRQIGKIIVADLKKQKDSNHNRIDNIKLKDKYVKLPPPPYKQALPYLGENKCDSLTIDRRITNRNYNLLLWFLIIVLIFQQNKN